MTAPGNWTWLSVLRTPNADVERLNTLLDTCKLRIPTRLDALGVWWLNDVKGIRSVLLVAHAGDGKTEFLRDLTRRASQSGVSLRTFDREASDPSWSSKDAWILNDPSQLPTARVIEFLSRAFSTEGGSSARFVAGINRGLLRAVVQLDTNDARNAQDWSVARAWLRRALSLDATTVIADAAGRIAAPLDRRVLVPGPGDSSSCAADVTRAVLAKVHKQSGATWNASEWADHVARVLSLAEASGHHVTFREVLALSAAVGEALSQNDPPQARRVLFMERGVASSPSLKPLGMVLRRLDPAKVPNLEVDVTEWDAADRDSNVRKRALENLAAAFAGSEPAQGLPYRTAGLFLSVCRHVTSNATADVESALKSVFRGLARIAWGARDGNADLDVLPLTSPVHPGTTPGGTRVLRGALSVDSARFVADSTDHGEFIERGLTLPALVILRADSQDPPPLRLDLELFDMLARVGQDRHATAAWLGARVAQVNAWFDALVAHWEDALVVPSRAGLVAFQTFLGDAPPLALKPSRAGAPQQYDRALTPATADGVLVQARANNIVLTPSACASALLRWAGFVASPVAFDGALTSVEREALGAASIPRLMRRSDLKSPAFPWSSHTLGLAVDRHDKVLAKGSEWETFSLRLGAACAAALGFYDGDPLAWRGALRAAWSDDEDRFDTHPSARLIHQRLGAGVDGHQLDQVDGVPPPTVADVRRGVVADLLSIEHPPPFSRPSRWWLLGTWASWWLMLDGLRVVHKRKEVPVLLPWVDDRRGADEYERVRAAWFAPGTKPPELEAVQMLAQGAGWCSPASAISRFDLHLDGPMLDLIKLVAWNVHRAGDGRPDQRTLTRLQDALLDAGLYARPPGRAITDRVPAGALAFSSPESMAFDVALRTTLHRLAMLDTASDGITLFNMPWGKEADR